MASHMPRDDRRSEPRRSIEVDARLAHDGGEVHGVVVNISFGGAKFITTSVASVLDVGARVTLTVTQDGDDGPGELSWGGAVVRSERSGDDGPPRIAYAIAFDESAPRSLPAL